MDYFFIFSFIFENDLGISCGDLFWRLSSPLAVKRIEASQTDINYGSEHLFVFIKLTKNFDIEFGKKKSKLIFEYLIVTSPFF